MWGNQNHVYGRSVCGRKETTMAKARTLPSFCYDKAHSDAHVSLAQTMNESDREEPMKEEVQKENGKHVEAEDEVVYLSLSRDEDFASEKICRENFFLIGANTKYG